MPTSAPDLTQIETPAVLLDLDQLLENARSVQRAADSRGIEVRPHVKTHKCLAIAKLQIEEGATGVTASKTDEALQFISGGIQSVTVAYPIVVPAKLDRLIETAASHEAELRIIFDSETGVEAIAEATRRHATTVGVLLKVDVGLHRCGLQEDDPRLIPLVKKVAGDESLRFLGLLSHAGQAYAAPDAESVRQIAKQECEMLGRIRRKLEGEGIEVPIISVGSTPTVLASDTYDGITEIRPGNYVFMDRTPIRLGLVHPDKAALTVLATIVSANSDYFIIDTGSKVLSSDLGAHGNTSVADFGFACPVEHYAAKEHSLSVAKLSEEHGFIKRDGVDLPIGSRVRIIPNHSCVVANLVGEYTVLKGDGSVESWPLEAQSCVR